MPLQYLWFNFFPLSISLCRTQQDDEDSIYKGKLKLAMKFQPYGRASRRGRKDSKVSGSLHVSIKEAGELPKMDPFGLTDATVKIYLLPNRSSSSKKKTRIVKDNLNPVWNEDFEYKFLNLKELKTERVLEVTVWDFDRRGSNDFIGGLRLGPPSKHKEWMDSVGEEVEHWEEVLARPGEWVERWHDLRSSMSSLWKQAETRISRNINILSPIGETLSGQQSPACRDVGVSGHESTSSESSLPSSGSPDVPSGSDNGVPARSSEQRAATTSAREFSPIPEVSVEEQEPPDTLKERLGVSIKML